MMKKKVMPLSCLMAVAMLAGCGTAAPAVPEETTAPAAEIAEVVQETAPANDTESEAAAVEETAADNARPPIPIGFSKSQHKTALITIETNPE